MRGNILFAYIIGFCPSLAMQTTEPTKQAKGIVGGFNTFLTPVLITGSLVYKGLGAAAMVFKGVSDTELMDKFKGRLQWDSQTGLFTITHLRTEDSGTYAVDCKDGQNKLVTFQLEVYKNVSTPTVMWTQLGRKNCSVRCSVENGKEVNLSWRRDEETLSHSSNPDINTSLSLLLGLDRERHTYYCEANNPVSSQRYLLDIPRNCTEDSDQKSPGVPRKYIAIAVCSVLFIIAVMGIALCLRKRRNHFAQGTNTLRRRESDLHYAEISHNNQGETQHDMKLTSVYDELHLPRDPPAAVDC